MKRNRHRSGFTLHLIEAGSSVTHPGGKTSSANAAATSPALGPSRHQENKSPSFTRELVVDVKGRLGQLGRVGSGLCFPSLWYWFAVPK